MPKQSQQHRKLIGKPIGVLLFCAVLLVGLGVVFSILIASHVDNSNPSTTPLSYAHNASKAAQQKVANNSGSGLYPCIGNQKDSCKNAPSIDFWPGGSEGASNPAFAAASDGSMKQIMGRILGTNGTSLLLKTTSGRTFTINYPLDVITNFNTNIGPNYPVTVQTGDAIFVTYSEYWNDAATTIQTSQISSSTLILKDTALKKAAPNTPPQKY